MNGYVLLQEKQQREKNTIGIVFFLKLVGHESVIFKYVSIGEFRKLIIAEILISPGLNLHICLGGSNIHV